MVEFLLTESEYLFWIPPAAHQRATRISGGRWDAARGCWIFPRTRQVRDQLQAEFGKEARRREPSLATQSHDQKLAAEEAELGRLRNELQQRMEEVGRLKQAVLQAKSEMNQLRLELEHLKEVETRAQSSIGDLKKVVEQLRTENAKLQNAEHASESVASQIRAIALQATGNSKLFSAVVETLEINEFLPLLVKNKIEVALYRYLGLPGATQELTDLIRLAKSNAKLGEEDIDLLYLIRDQRNAAAHPRGRENSLRARAIIALLAAAIVWPRISP